MKKILFLISIMLCTSLHAQVCPDFTELSDSRPADDSTQWHKRVKRSRAAWGSTAVHYERHRIPENTNGKLKLRAWRGERVNAQAVFWTAQAAPGITLSKSELRNGKHVIAAENIELCFVRYVLTDSLKNNQGGCGYRLNKAEWDSLLVADILDPRTSLDILQCSTRPVWLSVSIPADAQPGTYKGSIGIGKHRLPYEITVLPRTLTAPQERPFHVDFWQNPYAAARFFNVPLWSDEHFEAMRPNMKKLAEAGQKVITTAVMNRPWNGQTEDAFRSMVMRLRHPDGTWTYDYTVFDRWVEYVMSFGITQQINCYTMVPWNLEFDYVDVSTAGVCRIKAQPGTQAYEDYWLPFLKDFARHLKEKGWFERTCIALDERPRQHMRAAIELLQKADPGYRISSQCHYYPEVEPQVYDLCLPFGETLPAEVRERRAAEGKVSTVYTCCTEARPNVFVCSATSEAVWLPLHAMASGLDGYLRWAYNSWTKSPLQDARFRTWVGGDCYIVYPGASSIRMERFIEGLQAAEKVRLLREEYRATGNESALKPLEEALSRFRARLLQEGDAEQDVNALLPLLNP